MIFLMLLVFMLLIAGVWGGLERKAMLGRYDDLDSRLVAFTDVMHHALSQSTASSVLSSEAITASIESQVDLRALEDRVSALETR